MGIFSKRPSFSRLILPVIATIGLVVAVLLMVQGKPDRTIDEPETMPPQATGDLADAPRVAGAGIVEPSSEIISIGTALSGIVTDVAVRPGDYVSRGQSLFTVDERAVKARIKEAEAAIAEARAAERTAMRQLELYRKVEDPLAVSRAEVIRAEGEASAARNRLDLARAQLASARVELERLTVQAPISGEILRVDVRPGEFVQAGGPTSGNSLPYVRMGETRPLHVRIDIDEDDAARIGLGKPALVSPRGAAERQVRAKFVRTEPLIVPKRSLTNSSSERVDVRVLQVIYELPRVDGLFRVGQQVDAFIPARDSGDAK